MNERLETRDAILKAATDRILHYGYGKTTMAEIASDCSMSAGNIYRFFKSKIDIAEAMARKRNTEVFQKYVELSRDKDRSSLDRLKEFFIFRMERTYDLLEKNDKTLEIAEVLSEERPTFANEQLAQERIYLTEILNQGVAKGEIKLEKDVNHTAEMLQVALMKFGYPQLWSHLSLDKLHREINGVMDIVCAALRCKTE